MMNLKYNQNDIKRFSKYVNIVYKNDGTLDYDKCWEWTGGKHSPEKTTSYGNFGVSGQMIRAHRFSYIVTFGPILDNETCVCHECDNTLCVNPYHLWLGTQYDNIQDRVSKNRSVGLCGEENGFCNISDSSLNEMFQKLYKYEYSSIKEASKEYNVSPDYIKNLIRGNHKRKKLEMSENDLNKIKLYYVKQKRENSNIFEQIVTDLLNGKYTKRKDIINDYSINLSDLSAFLSGSSNRVTKYTRDRIREANSKLRFSKRALTDDQVRNIRTLFGTNTYQQIANMYGISKSAIKKIRIGESYSDVI